MEDPDSIASASLLLNASGVHRQVFPKTYHTRITKGFAMYIVLLTCFLFGYTLSVSAAFDTPVRWEVIGFDFAYLACLLAFIFCQVPKRVVRENDRILMIFCCGTRAIPIESIKEVRAVRRRRDCRRSFRHQYPTKCFWGYPTNLDRNIIIVTDTHCNNYFFSLKEMDEFIADNWPDAQGSEASAELRPLEPAVLGNPAAQV